LLSAIRFTKPATASSVSVACVLSACPRRYHAFFKTRANRAATRTSKSGEHTSSLLQRRFEKAHTTSLRLRNLFWFLLFLFPLSVLSCLSPLAFTACPLSALCSPYSHTHTSLPPSFPPWPMSPSLPPLSPITSSLSSFLLLL